MIYALPVLAYRPAPGTKGGRAVWIDLHNDVTWSHSGEGVTYTNWANNEPKSGSEACARRYKTWGDVGCARIYGFLCEKEWHTRALISTEI